MGRNQRGYGGSKRHNAPRISPRTNIPYRSTQKKGCAVLAFLLVTSPLAAGYGLWNLFT